MPLLSLLLWMAPAHADERGARLAELRAEAEALHTEVARERADLDAQLADFDTRRREIELEVDRERLALDKLLLRVSDARAESAGSNGLFDGLQPVLIEGIATLRARIEAGIPFRIDERLAALDALEASLRSHTVPPDRAASRLWQQVEDELSLSRENALDRQVLSIDGTEHLVEVARLGMIAMYWRTEAGRVGWVGPDGQTLSATTRTERAQIEALFTALDRRIRSGWFELPGLPEASR